MNKIFSSVWNKKLGCVVAASEHARRHGGGVGSGSTGSGAAGARSMALALVAGLLAIVPFQESAALTLGQGASATGSNTAIGDTSRVDGVTFGIQIGGNRRTDTFGSNATAWGPTHGVVLGYGAQSSGTVGTALGSHALTNGSGALAVGNYATARSRVAMSIGTGALTSAGGAMAIGAFSAGAAARAMAIGNVATASGVDSNAIGTSANASGARSIAFGAAPSVSTVNGDEAVQNTTTNTSASGEDSVAIGTGARSTGKDTIALGTGTAAAGTATLAMGAAASAAGTGAVALGHNANATTTNSVALGSWSTTTSDPTAAAFNPGSGELSGRSTTAYGEVSVGAADRERRVTNLAAGAAATDAVNVSQLQSEADKANATGAAVASALGGDASYDASTGAITAPSYSVGGSTVANVGDAIENLDGRVSTAETSIDGLDDRLTTTEGNVSDLTGRVDTAESDITAINTNVAGLDDRLTTTQGDVGDLTDRMGTAEGDITTINTNVSNLDGRVTTVEGSIADLSNQLNSGETGLVRQDAESGAITVAADKAGSTVDFAGTDGARTLAGVAVGELAADSTDAVNGAQLFATNERVSTAKANIDGLDERLTTTDGNVNDLTGRMDTAEGDITTINTNVAGLDERVTTTEGNVGDLTDRMDTAEGDIATINTNVGNLDGRVSTVEGDIATINTNIGDIGGRVTTVEGSIADLSDQLDSGETGLVRQDAESNAITVAADKAGSTVDFSGTDGARTLTGVAAGDLAENSTDAVNGAQLFATNERVSTAETNIEGLDDRLTTTQGNVNDLTARVDTAEGDITTINTNVGNLDGRVSTVESDITTINTNIGDIDGRVTNVEGSVTNLTEQLNTGEAGLVRQDAESNAITVAADKAGSSVDFAGTDGARTLTGVAAGELAEGSTDAVNGSQLFATNERVSTAETNIEGLDGRLTTAEGDITAINTNVAGLDERVTTSEGNVGDLTDRMDTAEGDITTINTNIGDLDGRVTTVEGSIADLNDQLNSGEAGLVRQDAESGTVTVAADKAGSTVDFAGADGARTLTGVAAGELAEDSTDAVNGSQLFATNERVSTTETNIEGLDDRLTTTQSNVVDLTDRIDTAEGDITTINTNVSNLDGRVSTVEGDIATINTNIGDIDGRVTTVEGSVADLSDQLNSGETGLVLQEAETGAITVAADKAGSSVDFAGTDGSRTLTGVAAGELAADSTDAVNGSQLFATNERVGAAETNVEGLDGRLTTGEGGITALNTNVAGLDDRLTTTEGNVVDLTDRIDTAEGDITTINTNVSNLDGRVTTVEGSIADLSDQLNSGETGLVRQDAESGAITVAADKAGSSVDFNGTDGARKLTGVAAGELTENSTDAVNGAQLFAINERVSTAETSIDGLDDRLTTTEGDVSDLTGRVDTAEGDISTINANVSNLDGRVTTVEGSIADLSDQLNSGETGLVRQNAESGAITVAADKAGSSIDFAGTDGARTLTGVAAGELAADSTDAVNGAQLFATDERVSTAETNIAGLDDRLTTTQSNVGDLTDRMDTAEGDITTLNTNVSNLDGRVTTVEGSIADLSDQLNSGETGLVRQDADTGAITLAADKGGSSVDFSGIDGARKLTGVAAGELTENSTEAVNGSQLFSTNERLSTAQTSIQGLDGRVTTVEGSVSELKDSLNSGETGLVRQNPETGVISMAGDKGGAAVNFANIDGQARVLSGVAEGVEETDAVNVRQLRSSGLIDEDGKTRDVVSYDGDAERRSVTFNSTGAPVLLQNVAAGRANTDAANVGQVRDAVALMGGGAHIDANGKVVAPNYVVDEVSYNNVGDALKGLAEQAGATKDRVTVVEQVTSTVSNAHIATGGDQKSEAKAQGSNAVALGAAANASGASSTASGWGAQATGENSVSIGANSQALGDNSMAIGNSARAVAGNSVAIGAGSMATRDNTVSVGSVGNERAIANVADGVAETDAVNVRQLDSSMNSALNYTNQQLNQLQNEIQSVKRDSNANAAAAMAVANLPQSVIPGKGMASAAVSNMGGESAVAVGVSKFSEDARWVTKFSGTVNTRGNAGVAAGIGFHW